MTTEHIMPSAELEGETRLQPRIEVARLSDLMEGSDLRSWLDAAVPPAFLEANVAAVLPRSNDAEEYVITDAEDFAGLELTPSAPLSYVAQIASGLREHGPPYRHWAELVGRHSEFLAQFKGHYFGFWPSPAAWAENFMVDLGFQSDLAAIRAEFRSYLYVDYGHFAADRRTHGEVDWRAGDGGVHVFLTPWPRSTT